MTFLAGLEIVSNCLNHTVVRADRTPTGRGVGGVRSWHCSQFASAFQVCTTPSMLDVAPHLDAYVTAESFAQAALRLLTCRPIDVGGMALYGEDVLHPELGTRGWLADSM